MINETLRQQIYAAATTGNSKQLDDLLSKISSPNTRTDYLRTIDDDFSLAIHHAARNGHLDCVKCLIKHGSPLYWPDALDFTPLHYAALRGSSEMTHVIINAYYRHLLAIDAANPDAELQEFVNSQTLEQQQTALHLAAASMNLETCAVLLIKGKADPELSDISDKTPLTSLAGSDQVEYYEKLNSLIENRHCVSKLEFLQSLYSEKRGEGSVTTSSTDTTPLRKKRADPTSKASTTLLLDARIKTWGPIIGAFLPQRDSIPDIAADDEDTLSCSGDS